MSVNKLTGNVKPLDVVDKTNECVDEINRKVPNTGLIATKHYEASNWIELNGGSYTINLESPNAISFHTGGTVNINFEPGNAQKVITLMLYANLGATTINWGNAIWTDASRITSMGQGGVMQLVILLSNTKTYIATIHNQ